MNEEAFFTASAFKPQGSIVKYEWDFDSPSRVSPDSVDFTGFSFATHSYNSTPEDDEGYLVVIKVTDNDGLIATNYCQIPIVIDETINCFFIFERRSWINFTIKQEQAYLALQFFYLELEGSFFILAEIALTLILRLLLHLTS